MTDNAEQGYTGADVAALGSILIAGAALLLAMFLPARDIFAAIVVAIAAIALAVFAGARTRGRGTAWLARIGSGIAVIAVIVVIIGQIVV